MQYQNSAEELVELINENLDFDTKKWFFESLDEIVNDDSSRKLYLIYSLCAGKIPKTPLVLEPDTELKEYLSVKEASILEIARITLLAKILTERPDFFSDKVRKLIEIADIGELETFLKFLVLLPNPETYQFVAVEALRTNIATIFDAISMNNPYPSLYFNEQQWNQMYLKAAFMQRDLGNIVGVDKRANKELTRIISDYAHERWAASREIDPEFWRPVSNFLNGILIEDVTRLFESENTIENKAATLVCYHSNLDEAKRLLKKYPKFLDQVENKSLTWKNFKS